jgi:ankyrin repeat protein
LKARTALQAAAEQGHDAIVTMLQATADINAERAEIGGITALEAPSKGGNLAVVVPLLEAGADVNIRAGVEGGTSFH